MRPYDTWRESTAHRSWVRSATLHCGAMTAADVPPSPWGRRVVLGRNPSHDLAKRWPTNGTRALRASQVGGKVDCPIAGRHFRSRHPDVVVPLSGGSRANHPRQRRHEPVRAWLRRQHRGRRLSLGRWHEDAPQGPSALARACADAAGLMCDGATCASATPVLSLALRCRRAGRAPRGRSGGR